MGTRQGTPGFTLFEENGRQIQRNNLSESEYQGNDARKLPIKCQNRTENCLSKRGFAVLLTYDKGT